MDPLIADMLSDLHERHQAVDFERDPQRLCARLGLMYASGSRNLASYGDRGVVLVEESQFQSRQLFSAAHEIAHHLMRQGGWRSLILHHHASVPNMKLHLERLTNHGGAQLLIPQPYLREARRLHGERPGAILHLMQLSGASEGAAMRRWALQDLSESRAAFVVNGRIIGDAVRCNAQLPFWTHDRVPEVTLQHPDVAAHYLGRGRLMGVYCG